MSEGDRQSSQTDDFMSLPSLMAFLTSRAAKPLFVIGLIPGEIPLSVNSWWPQQRRGLRSPHCFGHRMVLADKYSGPPQFSALLGEMTS